MSHVSQMPVPDRAYELARLDRVDLRRLFRGRPQLEQTPLQWIRAALDASPGLFRAVHFFQRAVLGLNLAPFGDPDHPLGWDVLLDNGTEAMAGSNGPFGHGRIIALTQPGMVVVATVVELGGVRGRSTWMFGQFAHRAVARHALATIGKLGSATAT